jgi:hypothetical protein
MSAPSGQAFAAAPAAAANGTSLKSVNTEFTMGTVHIIAIAVISLVLLAILLYILSLVRATTKQRSLVTKNVIRLEGTPVTASGASLATTHNGHEFTYAFWIYVSDQYAATSHPKRVLARGSGMSDTGASADVSGANPVVYLGANSNRLTVALQTNQAGTVTLESAPSALAAGAAGAAAAAAAPSTSIEVHPRVLRISIDYLPLQRWVHVAFGVQDSLVTVYMDGDIYAIKNVRELSQSTAARPPGAGPSPVPVPAAQQAEQLMILKGTTGDIVLGDPRHKTPGYVSYIEFFNYFLPQNDVQKLYARGPSGGGFLASLMAMDYGFRSPVYKRTATLTAN